MSEDRQISSFPGATSWFSLLAEVLLVGVLITVISLPLITLPVALAVGVRHLRRYGLAEGAPMSLVWRDLRASALGGVAVGVAVLLAVAACLFDIGLAAADATPVGSAMRVIGIAGLAVLAVGILIAASLWRPERGWRSAVGGVRPWIDRDLAGVAYLLLVAGFVVFVTWQLAPLVVPALGCAALAVVAIPVRARRKLEKPARK